MSTNGNAIEDRQQSQRSDDDPPSTRPPRGPLPRPHLKRMSFPFPVIWIIPILAAIGGAYYMYGWYQHRGPVVRIHFSDAAGIKVGETPLTVHGVRVGTVEEVDLSPDAQGAILHIRMQRSAIAVTKADSIFWMVRPDIFGGQITGIGTIISGPFIEAVAGNSSENKFDFDGLEHPPVMLGEGIRVIVHAVQVGKLDLNTSVSYRGIRVGQVQDIRLADDSRSANLTLFIQDRYKRLLRSDSQFWRVKSTDVTGGLLGGLDVHLGSLQSILGGGIQFATPEASNTSVAALDGTTFELREEMKPEWLQWSPRIELPPTTEESRDDNQGLRSAVRVR